MARFNRARFSNDGQFIHVSNHFPFDLDITIANCSWKVLPNQERTLRWLIPHQPRQEIRVMVAEGGGVSLRFWQNHDEKWLMLVDGRPVVAA